MLGVRDGNAERTSRASAKWSISRINAIDFEGKSDKTRFDYKIYHCFSNRHMYLLTLSIL